MYTLQCPFGKLLSDAMSCTFYGFSHKESTLLVHWDNVPGGLCSYLLILVYHKGKGRELISWSSGRREFLLIEHMSFFCCINRLLQTHQEEI